VVCTNPRATAAAEVDAVGGDEIFVYP